MARHLDTCMTVLAADLKLTCVKLMREWNRLLWTIADISHVVTDSKIDDQEYDACHGSHRCYTDLHAQVKTACEHYHPLGKRRANILKTKDVFN